MDEEKKYSIAFSVFPGIGPLRYKLLLDYFGSAKESWNATKNDLHHVGLHESLVERFDKFRTQFSIEAYIDQLRKLEVYPIVQSESKYPALLKSVSDCPIVLYVKGKKNKDYWDISKSIGVVGTRRMSPYGEHVTKKLTADLVQAGLTIVSGLAYGIDAVAHQQAIDSGGKTIAVLGCGIDIIAPPSNAHLYRLISEGRGAIVSEMPLGLRPNKGLFPSRNRIISGLSLGILLTEGADDSGALITARYAAEQGREVFAVPGPITSAYSKASAKLLKNGAKLVEDVDDILDELGINSQDKRITTMPVKGDTPLETHILEILSGGSMSIDEIIHGVHESVTAVSGAITVLEMKGRIQDVGNKSYIVSK